jgi:Ca2+-binding EF-hand superfamily protein
MRDWFNMFDTNKDGTMDYSEFRKLLKEMGVGVRESDLEKIFDLMDLSSNGRISYNEFCDVLEKG